MTAQRKHLRKSPSNNPRIGLTAMLVRPLLTSNPIDINCKKGNLGTPKSARDLLLCLAVHPSVSIEYRI